MESSVAGTSGIELKTRRQLFEIMQQCTSNDCNKKLDYLENLLLTQHNYTEEQRKVLKHKLSHFKSQFKRRWSSAKRTDKVFRENNKDWLNGSIELRTETERNAGRPVKDFEQLSDRSKRRKTAHLRENVSAHELTYAAQMNHRAEGNVDIAVVMKNITETPKAAVKFRKVFEYSEADVIVQKHTPPQALAVFIEANLFREQYEIIQAANKKIYPCYSILKKAKEECYPKAESIHVTECSAEIKLQDILNHTSLRLCQYLDEALRTLSTEEKCSLELLSKWGCDGSQQSQFKQKFYNDTDGADSNIFQSSFVPLRLRSNINGVMRTIWQNPVPSSPKYCRPIRIRFVHETRDITNEEIEFVENQIKTLTKNDVPTSSGIIHIQHIMVPTMVDAKVCNAATCTSSTMRSYICGERSKDFNILTQSKEENPETLKFGLSIFHARSAFLRCISFFDCIK